MFISIMTVVSVVGFASLYGYEMLQLYLRGELYLPWYRESLGIIRYNATNCTQ